LAILLYFGPVEETERCGGDGSSDVGSTGDNIMWVEDWAPRAACRDQQPDQLFVRGAEQNKAKQVCTSCAVRTECLAEALDNQIEWGVWGGMTERERRALLRRRPAASWRKVLEDARDEQVIPAV
jgi:WhiB family redox-sensing transcriptional regulator